MGIGMGMKDENEGWDEDEERDEDEDDRKVGYNMKKGVKNENVEGKG